MLGGVTAPSAPEFHRRTSTYTRPPGTSHATQLDPRSSLPSRFEDENVTQIAGGLVGRPPARQLVSRKRGTLTPPAEGRSGCCIPPDPAAHRKPRFRLVTSISAGASSALLGAVNRARPVGRRADAPGRAPGHELCSHRRRVSARPAWQRLNYARGRGSRFGRVVPAD